MMIFLCAQCLSAEKKRLLYESLFCALGFYFWRERRLVGTLTVYIFLVLKATSLHSVDHIHSGVLKTCCTFDLIEFLIHSSISFSLNCMPCFLSQ